MGAILILGRPEDLCCQLVQAELSSGGRDVWFLSEDQLFPDLRFVWAPLNAARSRRLHAGHHDGDSEDLESEEFESGGLKTGAIEYRGKRQRFDEIDGVFCRFYGIPIQPEDYGTPNGQYISAEWNALLMVWLNKLACPVFNRLRPELWYKSHLNVPDLASLVPRMPFTLPRALVTTVHDDALAFCRSAPGPVRYSPLTQPARYRIQTEAHREQLALLDGAVPFYLTECVEGRALEAFVTGSDVVFVDADGNIDGDAGSATRGCLEIGASLGIGFYRLALVKADDDHWFCLGLDRVPQLHGCAPEAQLQISRSLAGNLSGRSDASVTS